MPCGVVTLITQNEILWKRSSIPDDELRIWLLSDPDQRGIAIGNGYVTKNGADAAMHRSGFPLLPVAGQGQEYDQLHLLHETGR